MLICDDVMAGRGLRQYPINFQSEFYVLYLVAFHFDMIYLLSREGK